MKILVVDDHSLVREGLCQVLKGTDAQVEVLQSPDCVQAFALAQAHSDLDLVLLDYHLPDMSGLEALRIFGLRHPELPILMLSGSVNVNVMRQVLQAGACGFVTKSSQSEELLEAVRRVMDGDVYLPLELRETTLAPSASATPALTTRQELVLRELIDGCTNREISESMHISEETVKSHVTAILRHFNAQNRTQAVVAAANAGYRALPG